MQKVVVYKWVKQKGSFRSDKIYQRNAVFVDWGLDYRDHDTYACHYTVAIVRDPLGFLSSVPVSLIQFID